MIILLRSTDGEPDSRFEKYTDFLRKKQLSYFTLCWDRMGKKIQTDNNLYYQKKAKYGDGIKNIIGLIGFNWFLIRKLICLRKKYRVIHACDFDTIFPAILLKIFFRKKVIYDIFDWYIDSRGISNPLIRKSLLVCEYINIKLSDVVIVCEEERIPQIIYTPSKIWVLPNIPYFKDIDFPKEQTKCLTLSYVGILMNFRGIDKIVKYAKANPNIRLKVAGFGTLESLFTREEMSENIEYYGAVKYLDGLKIMNSSDIICAIYEKNNPNHIYAAPNKYYEGLYLGKPIITTEGTLVGNKTAANKTGFVIGEYYENLKSLLDNLQKAQIQKYSENAQNLWLNKYKDYVLNFFECEYFPFIMKSNE